MAVITISREWDTSSPFDLVIDTGKISRALAVKWVVEAVKSLETRKEYQQPTTKTLEVAPLLSQIIAETFDVDETTP